MIGSFLQKRLHQLGLTQQQAADILEISQSRLNQYLKNRREPDSKMLMRICKAFNTTPNYLFGFNELSPEENKKKDCVNLDILQTVFANLLQEASKEKLFCSQKLGKIAVCAYEIALTEDIEQMKKTIGWLIKAVE